MNANRPIIYVLIALVGILNLHSQNPRVYSSQRIQSLINSDSIDHAEKELINQHEYYLENEQYDSIAELIYYFGKIPLLKGESNFLNKSDKALKNLLAQSSTPSVRYKAFSGLASLTGENGFYKESYDFNKLGLEAAQSIENDSLNKMALRTYGLASNAYFLRKFELVKKHGIEAYKLNLSNPEATATNIYNACNIVGLMMQNENKLDSAMYYFSQGKKALQGKKGDLNERFYYPAILDGNIAIIYMNQGKLSASLKTQRSAISNYKKFIDSSANHPNIRNIRYNYLSTINDMGSNYVKLGEIERALQLFEFNYRKAKEFFPSNSIQELIFINQYAQAKWVAGDDEQAIALINEAYDKFLNLSNAYAGYMTYSLGTKANILENLGRIEEAKDAYILSDSLYEMVSPGKYNFDRITKLREAALFYSRNNYTEEAINAAKKVINVSKQNNEDESSIEVIKSYALLAEVNFNLGNYNESIEWANKSLSIIDGNKESSAFTDNLIIDPKFIKQQASFYITDTTSVKALSEIYKGLDETIDLLNQRASKYTSYLDKNSYIYNLKPKLDFTIKVALKLYELNKDEEYLNSIISIHESRIYNRIRAKLGGRDEINFKDIPEHITQREKDLKQQLLNLRSKQSFTAQSINEYSIKNDEWIIFLDSLKSNYPKYYDMRYKTIKTRINSLKKQIPEHTTIVRYFYVEKDLYAFVATDSETSLVKLKAPQLAQLIETFSRSVLNEQETCHSLYKLYTFLWQPIANKIKTSKVLVIPDGNLFNLSFESLSSKKVDTYLDLREHCLLSKHSIFYNYSLELLNTSQKVITYTKDFIAFAPEFTDDMKSKYKIAISDSIGMDKSYLQLLPQPFTSELVKEYSRVFNGESFINEKASKTIFLNRANEHKIIHIGTHAESNNVSPELSRLIFAKTNPNENNSLYTYEIYNQNLASNLAILTACETGKPTHQPGEGMISLAHAFNYAGSESILTSLWKIDEQSSAEIIEYFYRNLKKKLPKDEALREAKLKYLSNAKGRTLAPQYWSGLILIGDTTPIAISSANSWWWLIILFVFVIVGVAFYRKRLSTKS